MNGFFTLWKILLLLRVLNNFIYAKMNPLKRNRAAEKQGMLSMNFIGIEASALPYSKGTAPSFIQHSIEGRWALLAHQRINVIDCFGYSIHYVGQMKLPEKPENLHDALRRAKGTFAYYVVQNELLYVGTDPMGFYPLYFTSSQNIPLAFSTSLTHLKRRFKNLTPNWDAWNLMLNGEDLLGDMTTIKEFRRLREGEVLCYSLNPSAVSQRTISFPFYKTPEQVSDDEFIEQGNTILTDVLSTLMGEEENNLIPLTAGHDSRRIANAAKQLGIPFNSITQSTRHATNCDVDTLVGRQTAELLGIPDSRYQHLPMPSNETIITQTLEKDYWTGFETPAHEWSVNMLHAIPRDSLICDGIVGDQIVTNSVYYNFKKEMESASNDTSAIVDFIVKKKNILPLNSVEQERRRSLIEASVKEYIDDEHTMIRHTVFNHTRRNTAAWYYPFLAKGNRVCLPFADLDFFHHGLSMSLDRKRDKLWQRTCIEAINPELASLHSTRDRHSSEYWREQGAAYVPRDKLTFTPEQVKIPKQILMKLERSFSERILDTIGLKLMPNKVIKSWAWRYLPLQRFAIFLDWLEEDETSLPVLSEGTPPFISNRALSSSTVTSFPC
ncbi:MAG: hypothetical protein CL840_04415 [Crocinitomicaceae bacterium]|nr:hypothetical protein [Crocinitomicaceae bacterium]